jgi:DNA-binding transcriptional LysR family regulator
MQLNRFDLNLLIALDALLREKNVTRAAERVFVSQPAMSAALHKLREYFNDPLLVRVGREMELTSRGESLVEPVREALLRIQMMLGTQPTFDPKTARRDFTVIMSEEAVPGVLPPLLRTLANEAPSSMCTSRWCLPRPCHGSNRRSGPVPVPRKPAHVRPARLSRQHPLDAVAHGEMGMRVSKDHPRWAIRSRSISTSACSTCLAGLVATPAPRISWCATC